MKHIYHTSFTLFIIITLLFVCFNFASAQTGTIYVSSTPVSTNFTLHNDNFSFNITTTSSFNPVYIAPSNHNYILSWSSYQGYNRPATTTTYLFTGDSIVFNGVFTPATIPNPPTLLTATAIPFAKVSLTWHDNSINESWFSVERSMDSGSTFTFISSISSNVTTFLNTGLISSTEYIYRVTASNSAGTSTTSNWATVTTTDPPPGLPIVNFYCNATISFSGATTYVYDSSLYAENWDWNFGNGYSKLSTKNSAVIYSPSTISQYTIREIAANILGTGTAYQNIYVELPPTQFNASILAGTPYGYQLTWKDNTFDESGFELSRRQGVDPSSLASASYVVIATTASNVTTYTDYGTDTTIGLDSTFYYGYQIRVLTPQGPSGPVTATGAAFAIASFYASPTSGYPTLGTMTVQFIDQSSNATTWHWDFGDGNTSNSQNPGNHDYVSSTNAIYYASESVNNALGFGSTLTKTIILNTYPKNLNSIVTSGNQVNLAWQNDALYEVGLEIHRQVNSGGYSFYTAIPAHSTTFIDIGLTNNTDYGYKVRSTTYQAVSDFTNAVIAHINTPVMNWTTYSSPRDIPLNQESITPEHKKYLP